MAVKVAVEVAAARVSVKMVGPSGEVAEWSMAAVY